MNGALGWYNRPLARLVRAKVRAGQVSDSAQVADAEEALKDARAATDLLPNNALALVISVQTHLNAAELFDSAGDRAACNQCLRQAGKDVQALEPLVASRPSARRARLYYFELVGDPKSLDEEYRLAEEARDPWNLSLCALQHYGKGEFETALKLLDGIEAKAPWVVADRILILAELPDGHSRAWRAYHDFIQGLESTGQVANARLMLVPYILLRLGRPLDARAAALQVLQHPELVFKTRREWHLQQQGFYAGKISEDELLQEARGSRWNLCEGYFSIGLSHLARGDREGARKHFRLAVATRVRVYFEYIWARAFLTRMDKDPKWPGLPSMP